MVLKIFPAGEDRNFTTVYVQDSDELNSQDEGSIVLFQETLKQSKAPVEIEIKSLGQSLMKALFKEVKKSQRVRNIKLNFGLNGVNELNQALIELSQVLLLPTCSIESLEISILPKTDLQPLVQALKQNNSLNSLRLATFEFLALGIDHLSGLLEVLAQGNNKGALTVKNAITTLHLINFSVEPSKDSFRLLMETMKKLECFVFIASRFFPRPLLSQLKDCQRLSSLTLGGLDFCENPEPFRELGRNLPAYLERLVLSSHHINASVGRVTTSLYEGAIALLENCSPEASFHLIVKELFNYPMPESSKLERIRELLKNKKIALSSLYLTYPPVEALNQQALLLTALAEIKRNQFYKKNAGLHQPTAYHSDEKVDENMPLEQLESLLISRIEGISCSPCPSEEESALFSYKTEARDRFFPRPSHLLENEEKQKENSNKFFL
ncbi:hypothetical protein [Legionella jordanis]|uniref:hypothetical protein n=1 Tax=Legionella jordanis TaxID=456 RepID=UPI000EFBD329|nr:hypothetical protein [Legionella jordanis]RMX04447.1 hypothetical protein EAW55_03160 [Legionella jordanis]